MEYIEIHSLMEECPDCGSLLADSLQRRPIQTEIKQTVPKFQTADTLLRFRFDIPKIDSFLGLATTDLCCITGLEANLILTRLCVRALLPERYGGLDSPFVFIADTGNRTDVYQAINFARQYGMDKERVADRILVIRAFTVPRVRKLLNVELPKIIQNYQIKSVIIPGLLNTIDEEPNMRVKEAKKEIAKIMKSVHEISRRVLVVTSMQEGKYVKLVLPEFKKRIHLSNRKYDRLTVELYNQGQTKSISLTKSQLKIIPKR